MFRRTWQTVMIALATNDFLKNRMQTWAHMSKLANRYVGGPTTQAAVEVSKKIEDRGAYASLFFMGEYHKESTLVEENVSKKIDVANLLGKSNLDVHVSVDPTQIGYSTKTNTFRKNALKIAQEIAKFSNMSGFHCLMLDMEDSSVTSETIEIHNLLLRKRLPVAITLQCYLHRTEKDMKKLIRQGAKVRLVRGSFAEASNVAFTRFKDIKANYRKLGRMMLSKTAKKSGFYPIFGTHDEFIQNELIELAKKNGWNQEEYEFEMLFGARPNLEASLIKRGEKLRLYLAFGADWWPYALRRIGENPKNGYLLAKAFFRL